VDVTPEKCLNTRRLMDDNIVFYKQQNSTETTQRCVKLFSRVKDLARLLEPMLKSFSEFYHVFDFDVDTPGNGYRSLTKVVYFTFRSSNVYCEANRALPYCDLCFIGVAAGSLLSSGKYAMDPELCGEKFEEITKDINVQLLKGFWNITETEALAAIAKISSVPVHVNKEISFLPESFTLPLTSTTSQYLTVPVPLTYSGRAPIQMRLISHKLLEGQESQELNNLVKSSGTSAKAERKLKKDLAPKSKHLVVHFHGGGFVAHTSKSHEPYLKSWARDLGIPILSVDYSLSPETPFPRALEECFYAYCWALKNCSMLGWTGDYVCLAGDSAGGNLCLTVSLRAAACGIRIPDGIMAAYPATLLKATPLPSRLLATFDLLLPLSVLMKCLGAYTGKAKLEKPEMTCYFCPPLSSGLDPLNSNIIHPQLDNSLEEYYQSPLLAPDHVLKGLPPVHIVACSLDPLLDDSVMFAKRLRAIGQPVTLSIVEGLPHGFIGLAKFSKEVKDSAKISASPVGNEMKLNADLVLVPTWWTSEFLTTATETPVLHIFRCWKVSQHLYGSHCLVYRILDVTGTVLLLFFHSYSHHHVGASNVVQVNVTTMSCCCCQFRFIYFISFTCFCGHKLY
uniref:Hormone-sensitive lipase n=1 Tax=Erpetoichthys calabaricus TaxID=27687 RepID=A0A8C4T5B4_ERPCA